MAGSSDFNFLASVAVEDDGGDRRKKENETQVTNRRLGAHKTPECSVAQPNNPIKHGLIVFGEYTHLRASPTSRDYIFFNLHK